ARTCLSPTKPRQTTITMSRPNDRTSLTPKFESFVRADKTLFISLDGKQGRHVRRSCHMVAEWSERSRAKTGNGRGRAGPTSASWDYTWPLVFSQPFLTELRI